MRIPLIQATLVLLSLLYSASALPGFLDSWSSYVGFAKEVSEKVVEFTNEAVHEVVEYTDKAVHEVVDFTNKAVHDAATQYAAEIEKIKEFNVSITNVVSKTQAMQQDIHDALGAHGVKLDDVSEMFSTQMVLVLENVKAEFSEPLPEEQSARYRQWALMVDRALDMVEDEFVVISRLWSMPEDDARKSFGVIKPELGYVLLVTGKLVDNHPHLVETIIIFSVFALIPEGWILRSLLRIFGFGPFGPVKGSVAALAQGQIWGGFVTEGSWFAILQSAGMKMAV